MQNEKRNGNELELKPGWLKRQGDIATRNVEQMPDYLKPARLVSVSVSDVHELLKFKAYLAYKDTSADLRAVLGRLQAKWNLENATT